MTSTNPNWTPHGLIATWFGSGLLPWAPGTWGSLAALPFAAALAWLGGPWVLSIATIVSFLVGVWASQRYAEAINRKDPGCIVIDEVAGQWLAILPIATNFWLYPVAFLAFRLFDITKPWPARNAENLPGGVGIMADDIIAGFYAGIVVWFVSLILQQTGFSFPQ
ncbi:MAG: phosphatidylglycerophosphatase A family protein [Alphaproteobacteria bacterium]